MGPQGSEECGHSVGEGCATSPLQQWLLSYTTLVTEQHLSLEADVTED